jgi:hypothetical protein
MLLDCASYVPDEQTGAYPVIDLPLEPDRQIPAMLGDAVLVVGLEETANDVCVVSIRPHAGLWDVVCEVLFGPEDGGRWG